MARFKLLDHTKPGKGVKKSDVKEDFSLLNFFKIYFRKFWKICSVNMLYFVFNFPLFISLLGFSGNFDRRFMTPAGPMYQQLNSVILHTGRTPAITALMGFEKYGRLMESSYAGTVSHVLMWIGVLTVFTFGLANCGMAYVLRNFAREEHAYVWADNVSAMKRNFRQAIVLGMLDILLCAILAYDVMFFRANAGRDFITNMMFWVVLLLSIVYFIMRFYMYIILVTFKLSIFKIIKNSFIFTFLCLKRNIVGLIGILLVIGLNYAIMMVFTPLGIILPYIFTVALLGFIGSYTAYPGIKKYMIDPYYTKEEPNPEDKIFSDD